MWIFNGISERFSTFCKDFLIEQFSNIFATTFEDLKGCFGRHSM